MAKIYSELDLKSTRPNFTRDQFGSLSAMKGCSLREIDEGHISYCIETGMHYIFNPGGKNSYDELLGYWREFDCNCVDKKEDLFNSDEWDYSNGQLIYCLENKRYYTFDTTNGKGPETGYWNLLTVDAVVVGPHEPSNRSKIWIDTSHNVTEAVDQIAVYEKKLQSLENQVNQLRKILLYGVIAGDSTIGGRTMIMDLAKPVRPDSIIGDFDDEEEVQTPEEEAPSKLVATVPNLAIKHDTLANFKKNYVNLIDGEIMYAEDMNCLLIYINGSLKRLSAQGGSGMPGSGGDNGTIEIELGGDSGALSFTNNDPNNKKITTDDDILHIDGVTAFGQNNELIFSKKIFE